MYANLLKSDQWFGWCRLKIFPIYSSGRPFVQRSRTIYVIVVEGIIRNISVKLFEFKPVAQEEMLFKAISYLQLCSPLVWWSGNICTIFVEGIMILFCLIPVVQKEISLKDISYLELWWPFCSTKQNRLFNFGRGRHEEHFCINILNLDQWFRRRCHLNIFLIYSCGCPIVQQSKNICVI